MSELPTVDHVATPVDISTIFNQLTTAEYNLAALSAALKDPDTRQELGVALLEAMEASVTRGLVFSDIKLKVKAGKLTASFAFPITDIKLPLPQEEDATNNGQ